jgi:hypothetical protein
MTPAVDTCTQQMTNAAKSALNAARAAKARATRNTVARHLSASGHGIPAAPRTEIIGRTPSGAVIRAVSPQVKMPTGAPAGRPTGAQYWPSPVEPDAKPIPKFCVTANGKPLSPKLAELIAARLKPIQKSPELARWESRLTGPAEKPNDWPEGVPFYAGCTIDPGIARAVVSAERAAFQS